MSEKEIKDESNTSESTPTDSAEKSSAALVEEIATYDESLAEQVVELRNELDDQSDRVQELETALKRTKADFENYKKRAQRRQEEIRERATEDFIQEVLSVRDNLVRALGQDDEVDIRPGVESTLEEFDRILADEDVSVMSPEPGTEVDPTRHEVLMRVDDTYPEGTVAEVYRDGYEMGDHVLREAQVTVSTGESVEDSNADTSSSSESK